MRESPPTCLSEIRCDAMSSDDSDEITQPGIPTQLARHLSMRPRRSPSQAELEVTGMSVDAILAVCRNTSSEVVREQKIKQFIGLAFDTSRAEYSEELARLKQALKESQAECGRLRQLLRDKDPRRER